MAQYLIIVQDLIRMWFNFGFGLFAGGFVLIVEQSLS